MKVKFSSSKHLENKKFPHKVSGEWRFSLLVKIHQYIMRKNVEVIEDCMGFLVLCIVLHGRWYCQSIEELKRLPDCSSQGYIINQQLTIEVYIVDDDASADKQQ